MKKFLISVFSVLQFTCSQATDFQPGKDFIQTVSQASMETKIVEKNQVEIPEVGLSLEPNEFSIKAGGDPLQFTARLMNAEDSVTVSYSLEGNAEEDLGRIDDNGLYFPPETLENSMELKVVARLAGLDEIEAQSTGEVAAENSFFFQCRSGSNQIPILANLYHLPEQTSSIPDFGPLKSEGQICMEQLDVYPREFSQGFPGLSDRFEWFALDIQTLLLIDEPGEYYIGISSDDGSQVFLDGKMIIDNDGEHSPIEKGTNINLEKGVYFLGIKYFQGPRYTLALELFWKKPNSDLKEHIPKKHFRFPKLIKPFKIQQTKRSDEPMSL